MNSPTSTMPTPSAHTWTGPRTFRRLICLASGAPATRSVIAQFPLVLLLSAKSSSTPSRELNRMSSPYSRLTRRKSQTIHRISRADTTHAIQPSDCHMFSVPSGSVQFLGDDLFVFLLRQHQHEDEIADDDHAGDDHAGDVDGVVEGLGDDLGGGFLRVAQLLPLRLHGGVL